VPLAGGDQEDAVQTWTFTRYVLCVFFLPMGKALIDMAPLTLRQTFPRNVRRLRNGVQTSDDVVRHLSTLWMMTGTLQEEPFDAPTFHAKLSQGTGNSLSAL
jgi:hypothetical protein